MKARDLLNYVDNDCTGLTPWEIDFVESITKQLDKFGRITDKQRKILEQIADERGVK